MPQISEFRDAVLPASAWADSSRERAVYQRLDADLHAEVLVIGGGFTGLSAALHLSERRRSVVLLEAVEPGWGGSGRSGGQVIPGLKYDPDQLELRYGTELGRRMVEAAGGAPDEVFRLVRRYRIQCDAVQAGWIQPAHCGAAMSVVRQRAEQWARRGVAAQVIDADTVSASIGCAPRYVGGWIDPRGGAVQPLAYARGLARAAVQNGATLYANSQVTSLHRRGHQWVAAAGGGRVVADKVILATNAYTGALSPRLARSVVPVYSFQTATAPLPDDIRATVFPHKHVASCTRRLLWYYRLDADGRLLLGGRGPFTDKPDFASAASLRKAVHWLFPRLQHVPFEYLWSGRVAMTSDHMPHLHDLGQEAYAGVGFNGRGVAMGTIMGRLLGELAAGEARENIPFPVTKLKAIPLHSLARPVAAGLIRYYGYLDRRDEAAA